MIRTYLIILVMVFAVGCVPPLGEEYDEENEAASAPPASTLFDEEENNGQEIINLTMLFSESQENPMQEAWIVPQVFRERWGVEIDFITVPSKDYNAARSTAIAAGNAPDIMQVHWEHVHFEQASGFLNLSEHYDALPYLFQRLEQFPEDAANLYEPNGNLYILPSVLTEGVLGTGLAMRMDILDKLGLSPPSSVHDLYEVLRAMQEAYPDVIPFTGFGPIINQLTFFGRSWDFTNRVNGYPLNFNYASGQYESAATHPRLRDLLRFLHRLYAGGLMDPDIFTQGLEPAMQKLIQGKSFASFVWIDSLPDINYEGRQESDFRMDIIFPINTDVTTYHHTIRRLTPAFALAVHLSEHPELDRVLGFVDWWLYSPEGKVLTNWGLEGNTYEMSAGRRVFAQKLLDSPEGPSRHAQITYGLFIPNFVGTWSIDRHNAQVGDTAAAHAAIMNRTGQFRPWPPTPRLGHDAMLQLEEKNAAMIEVVERSRMAFIRGELCLEYDWDAYVQELYELGVQDIVDIFNEGIGA